MMAHLGVNKIIYLEEYGKVQDVELKPPLVVLLVITALQPTFLIYTMEHLGQHPLLL